MEADRLEMLKAQIKGSITMVELLERCGLTLKRSGTRMVGLCPFHAEKSPSFGVNKASPNFAHCFGCGWSGDQVAFVRKHEGLSFMDALRRVAGLAGVPFPEAGDTTPLPPMKKIVAQPKALEKPEKPRLPPMRMLRDEEIDQLAKARGLNADALWIAAHADKRIGFAMWPKWVTRSGNWVSVCKNHFFKCRCDGPDCLPYEAFPSWCMTDATRNVGEFRRLDNLPYPREKHDPIKAWSTAGKSWPVGAAEIGNRQNVLLVEGGPDGLAAYHFLHAFGQLTRVAVVIMLGGGNRIAEEALGYFAGKRVRIMMDADEIKEQQIQRAGKTHTRRSRAGFDAALRWQTQLIEAGAAVENFDLTGLMRADGKNVKDLNDLALANAATLEDSDIQEAFYDWSF